MKTKPFKSYRKASAFHKRSNYMPAPVGKVAKPKKAPPAAPRKRAR